MYIFLRIPPQIQNRYHLYPLVPDDTIVDSVRKTTGKKTIKPLDLLVNPPIKSQGFYIGQKRIDEVTT